MQTGRDREYYLGLKKLPAGNRFTRPFFAGEVSLIFERRWADLAQVSMAGQFSQHAWRVDHEIEIYVRMATEVMDPDLPLADRLDLVAVALERIEQLGALGLRVAAAGQPD